LRHVSRSQTSVVKTQGPGKRLRRRDTAPTTDEVSTDGDVTKVPKGKRSLERTQQKENGHIKSGGNEPRPAGKGGAKGTKNVTGTEGGSSKK